MRLKGKFGGGKPKSVLGKWVMSYFIILAIPLLISVINYTYSNRVLMRETSTLNSFMLKNFQTTLDNAIQNLMTIQSEVAINNDVARLLRMERDNEEFSIISYQLVRTLSGLSATYDALEIMLYFDTSGHVVTRNTANDVSNIYRSLFRFQPDGYACWHENLSAPSDGELIREDGYIWDTQDPYLVIYKRSLPQVGTNKLASVVVMRSFRDILRQFEASMPDHSALFVMDREGHVLMNTDAEGFAFIADIPADQRMQKSTTFSHGGGRYFLSSMPSGVSGWQYAIAIPERVFMGNINRVRNTAILCVALGIALGVLFVRIFSKRQYAPVAGLIEMVQSRKNMGDGSTRDEYEIIQNALSAYSDENFQMKKELTRVHEQLRDAYLLSLLKGGTIDYSLDDMNNAFAIDIGEGPLLLIGISYETDGMEAADAADAYEYDQVIKFAIHNVFEELADPGHVHFQLTDGGMIFYLVHVPARRGAQPDEILAQYGGVLRRIAQIYQSYTNIRILTAMSALLADMEGLGAAYRQVMDAIEFQVFTGNGEQGTGAQSTQPSETIAMHAETIRKYIEKNYDQSEMNLTTIAQALHFHPKHISRVFKSVYGYGVLDYLNECRIEKAKELMETTQKKSEEISMLVGYNSLRTFQRAFVKAAGITPGQYAAREDKPCCRE